MRQWSRIIETISEKVILIGIQSSNGDDANESLEELKELAKTAGAETVGMVIQSREYVHPSTYIGTGKLMEVKDLIYEKGATGVICDDELTPTQMKVLSDELDTKVMDRTVLILDIFAQRASTAEGKIQVELAQLRYSMTRLAGYGNSMSRLGGGIGTRGPGETKLETDRRVIRNRISGLKEELKEVVRHRETTRKSRERNNIPVVAIVGYTNAGKSTLLNKLTASEVYSEDKLFATLDPTTRNYKLSSGQEILLTDTVGFINKLPHHLVDAFKSTLEEAKYADIILHVVDSSNPAAANQMEVVYETLHNLNVEEKPVITLFNKCDIKNDDVILKDVRAEKTFVVSAKTGAGLPDFVKALEDILRQDKLFFEGILAFKDAGILQLIRQGGELISEEYTENGIEVKAYVTKRIYGMLTKNDRL